MSFNYPFADYSNPTTPGAFTWESEQDPITQQQQAHTPADTHPSISPEAFQSRHLSPIPEQESVQQPQPQQLPIQQTLYQPPPTIQLQERVPPSQYRFDNIDESHFLQRQRDTARRSESRASKRPPLRVSVDETSATRPSTSSSTPTTGPGPSRVPHGRHVQQQSHPYKRPSSAGMGSVPGQVMKDDSRDENETRLQRRQYQMRPGLGGATSTLASSVHAPSMILPAVGSGIMTTSCPAARMHSWRVNQSQSPIQQRNVSGGSTVTAVTAAAAVSTTSPGGITSTPVSAAPTPAAQAIPLPQPQVTQQRLPPPHAMQSDPTKRYTIRTDVHYDSATNCMTAMFELPGLKKADLKITMSVCPYSRVRQLTISGRIHPVFPEIGYTVKERKFGEFARTIVVPPDTKASDVQANMEDGILILRVPGGVPAPAEEPQDIIIQ